MRRRQAVPQRPLRIAMVAPCVFPSPRGSQVLIRELAQALAERGHHVHLVTYPWAECLVPISGIFVHRVSLPKVRTAPANLGWWKLLLDLRLAAVLYRVVRRERIDVIHAHNYEGPLISYLVRWRTGVPVVYHSHNALSDELEHYWKPGWRRWCARRLGSVLDRYVPRRADFSIALTPELEGFLRAHGVPGTRLAVLPPGAGPCAISDTQVPKAAAFEGRFVVMYTGNLDAYQDLGVLCRGVEAFQEEVPEALLVVLTHEANWVERIPPSLSALVSAGRARVVVAPAFAVVRRWLTRADVLVCPRSSWSGFPIKLLNYMAAGRAVVAAEGSAKGIVDGETGLVFPNGDAEALAQALRRLFSDPLLRQRLGERVRTAAHEWWTWSGVASRLERIYAQVCSLAEQPRAPSFPAAHSQRLIASSRGRMNAPLRYRGKSR
jgi:glycosyltransferase involved in cell wall biosynthesis